jgi:uncharacterized membrane protein
LAARLSSDPSLRDRAIVQGALRAGLFASFALLVAGMVVASFEHASAGPVSLAALFGRVPLGSRLMGFGILVLGLTPVVRVMLLVLLWVREHDYRHAAIAGVVLVILIASVVLGHPA